MSMKMGPAAKYMRDNTARQTAVVKREVLALQRITKSKQKRAPGRQQPTAVNALWIAGMTHGSSALEGAPFVPTPFGPCSTLKVAI
jgi:hypothetical protein